LKIQNKNDNITTKPNDEINEDKSLFNISLNKSKETKEEILPIKTEVDEINILKPNIIPEKNNPFNFKNKEIKTTIMDEKQNKQKKNKKK